nr:MAG TPA: hypothetical protein [Caudoviricetes sp.]
MIFRIQFHRFPCFHDVYSSYINSLAADCLIDGIISIRVSSN